MDEPCVHWKPPRSLFFALPGRRCYECEAEEYAAWQASVRAKLNEALAHIALGTPYDWDELPCIAYPNCWLPAGVLLPPWGAYPGTSRLRRSA